MRGVSALGTHTVTTMRSRVRTSDGTKTVVGLATTGDGVLLSRPVLKGVSWTFQRHLCRRIDLRRLYSWSRGRTSGSVETGLGKWSS